MEWLAENWFWVLIGIVFIAMHLFGHGGHGKQDDYKAKDQQRKNQGPNSEHGHN